MHVQHTPVTEDFAATAHHVWLRMHAHLFATGKGHPSCRGVKSCKQLVLCQHRGFGDFVEQRALARIGVAHQSYYWYRGLHSQTTAHGCSN